MLDDESLTSANLENDHGFIIKEYYPGMRPFGKPKGKSRELMLKVDNIIPLWRVGFV